MIVDLAAVGSSIHRLSPAAGAGGECCHAPENKEPADRQPRRNRDPRDARRGRARHPHRRDLLAGRPLLAASHEGGRELSGRRGQNAGRGLPGYCRHRAHREGRAGRRHPSRLRLFVREPRVRRGLRRRGCDLHRPDAGDHASTGQQGGGAQPRGLGRRAGDARDAAAAAR